MSEQTNTLRSAPTTLPQPLYLWEKLSGSRHFHFGYFHDPREPVATALDRLVDESTTDLAPTVRVLDVGCGLGGTSAMLARRNHDVIGIDPSAAAIAYATDRRLGPSTEFVAGSLEDFARTAPAASFDAIVMIEVLQHLPLARALRICHDLLTEGGVLVVCDVTKQIDISWARVPYHRTGTLQTAAKAADLSQICHRDITRFVVPTLPRMMQSITAARDTVVGELAASRPSVGEDLEELFQQLRNLRSGFDHGDLRYEFAVFQQLPAPNGWSPDR